MAEKLSLDTSHIWRGVGLALSELGGGAVGVLLAGKYGLSDQYSLAAISGGIVLVLLSILRFGAFGVIGVIMGSAMVGAWGAAALGLPVVSPFVLSIALAMVAAGTFLRFFNDY
ncbi:TPA: hypothetical protein L4U47_005503 [Pseudomonas aeruginosa]|uniref:hypothetical protein n=1 Tax=Pseudomonas TaxID=286 RepID=UPI000F4207D5|nr:MULTISPECIES: hypothetical protein [Pseudomonas]MDF3929396.1 hypothetical protein [Pseudomonas putida]RNF59853.1 hypothetical protein EFK27_26260 [Pseudomonas aeruginosa]CAI9824371.1 hypothetical protein JCHGIK_01265 [Pseudomonas aeruginosa]CAI9899210.1 hypothetical protein JCHGIK_01265 [Pseudomonas aeruginosa]HBO4513061.1 hypothetical protein [Pseudomonas aeruginosa]